ncbi:TolC family outer membrane protein [Novispirillum sp. DQ9]|uniref:TolC family outer membrane protein n=1 Tax=Novispirillum sp. DQ9 TaxID=3398612 RepID=UPI003C7A73E5
MKTPVSFAVACLLLGAAPAGAMTLEEALAAAYVGNPQLQAQRAAVRATDEQVPQALSGWRPQVGLNGSVGRAWVDGNTPVPGTSIERDPTQASATITQPVFRGFRTVNGVEAAENAVLSARSQLTSAEQQILLNAVEIYSGVLRDEAVVELNANNEQVLRRQLGATRDRFQVGEITRTDVSQAESRVSGARASRISAESQLMSSRATFQRIVGVPPEGLTPPTQLPQLPASLEQTVALALENQPDVLAAQYAARAADDTIDVVKGELLPEVSLQASHGRGWETQAPQSRLNSTQITANVTVPLYESGAVYSRVREAKQVASQRRIQVEQAQVTAREAAVQAWETLVAARAEIESRQAQVDAASTALEGVQREAQVGARTVLDVLDAEQELLDANVNLVRARHNERVAAFRLLSATGGLTAGNLGLPVEIYDPSAHYQAVRNQWFGTEASVGDGK